jgi:protein involved in polysaccharide export with SLBB domain
MVRPSGPTMTSVNDRSSRRLWWQKGLLFAALCFAVAGCESTGTEVLSSSLKGASASAGATNGAASKRQDVAEYRLGPGDKFRLAVLSDKDLTADHEIDPSGNIAVSMIGPVKAAGLTVRELEETIKGRLKDGYIKDPKLNVEVLSYRPFYIIGEVNKPGEYPYKGGVNVVSAVAIAGGYTYRGNTNYVLIRRTGDNAEKSYQATPDILVQPGDVLRIPERYF